MAEHQVKLVVRANCSACVTAEAELERICGELNVPWDVVDVDSDPQLRAEFGDRIPVILIDEKEHGFWKVEEERLRQALTTPISE